MAPESSSSSMNFYQHGSIASHACAGNAIAEMSVRVLDFRQNCSEAKHTVSSKNVTGTLLSDDITFMGLFRKVP